jgi:membrane-associated phospholipid phosphatase
MENLLWQLVPWGYEILLQIEAWRTSLLDPFFSAITELGGERFYIILFAIVYWCFSKPIGVGAALAALFSATFNAWLKALFDIPRPVSPALEDTLKQAGIIPRLTALFEETSPSWPSNHAQGSTVMWAYLAVRARRAWLWVVAVVLIALVAFSRMYGGVHFPQDVIGGVLLGVIFLALWFALEPRVSSLLASLSGGAIIGLSLGIPLVLLLILRLEDAITPMGATMGMGAGYVWQSRTANFSPAGVWWKRVLRAILGLVLVFAVYLGLSALFGTFDESVGEFLGHALRTFRYALVGLTGFYAAPWLFLRLGLAERET